MASLPQDERVRKKKRKEEERQVPINKTPASSKGPSSSTQKTILDRAVSRDTRRTDNRNALSKQTGARQLPSPEGRIESAAQQNVRNRLNRLEEAYARNISNVNDYTLDSGRQRSAEEVTRLMTQDKAGQFMLGMGEGVMSGATLGLTDWGLGRNNANYAGLSDADMARMRTSDKTINLPILGEVAAPTAYGTGRLAGQIAGYMIPSNAAAGAVQNTARGAKILNSINNSKMVQKLASQPWFRNAVARGAAKAGQVATEEMILGRAGEYLTRMGIDLMTDIPMGMVQSHNMAIGDGVEFGSDEYWKEMALNTALDVGAGGVMNNAPVLWNALGNLNPLTRSTKEILASRGLSEAAEEAVEQAARNVPTRDLPRATRGPAIPENTRFNPQNAPELLRREDRVLRELGTAEASKLTDDILSANTLRAGKDAATLETAQAAERRVEKRLRKLLTKSEITNGMSAAELNDFSRRVYNRAYENARAGNAKGASFSWENIRSRLRSVDDSGVDEFIKDLAEETRETILDARPREALGILEKEARAVPRPEGMSDEMYEAYIRDRVQEGYRRLKEMANKPLGGVDLNQFRETPLPSRPPAAVEELDEIAEAVEAPQTPREKQIVDTSEQKMRPAEVKRQTRDLLEQYRSTGAKKANTATVQKMSEDIDKVTTLIREGKPEQAGVYASRAAEKLELDLRKKGISLEPADIEARQESLFDAIVTQARQNAEAIDTAIGIGPAKAPGTTGGYTDEVVDISGIREGGYSSKVGYHDNKIDQNIRKSSIISDETKDMYDIATRSETEHRSNAQALKNARKRIEELGGTKESLNKWRDFVGSNTRVQSDDWAFGFELARQLDNAGDAFNAGSVWNDLAGLGSDSARITQMQQLLHEMTPQGREQAILKMAAKMSEAHKNAPIKVSDNLIEMLRNAKSQREIDSIMDAIKIDLWNQIPMSTGEKLRNFRYLAMLSRPTTHIRNIVGNAIFVPARRISDGLATIMEQALPQAERTRTFARPSKELEDYAEVFLESQGGVLKSNSRWNATSRPSESSSFGRRLFGRNLNRFNNMVTFSLEQGDVIFSEPVWKREFANVVQARGYNANTLTKELADEAAQIATERALSATYRNANFISDALNRLRESSKVAGFMTDAVIPFTKTPSNVLIKGYNYTPVGMMTGAVRLAKAAATGDSKLVTRAISQMAEGMTGTGIGLLGYFLAKEGLIQPSLDSSTAEGKFRKENGEQAYSIKIGDHSYSMDWAAPVCIPLFIGAEVAQRLGDDKDLSSWTGAAEGFVDMLNPVFEMSMLSGLENALNVGYNSNTPGAVTFAKNTLKNYAGSYIPTLASAVANTISPERKTTTSTAETPLEREWETYGRGLAQKIPGLNNMLEPYVNNLGERERKTTAGDYAQAFVDNFLSPGRLKQIRHDPVTDEIQSLVGKVGDEEGRKILPPSTSGYTVNFGDETLRMNEKELTAFKENRGQYARDRLNILFNSSDYKKMTSTEKAEAIQDIYTDALHRAQDEFLRSRGKSQVDIDFNRLSGQTQAKFNPRTMDKGTFVTLYNTTKPYGTTNGKLMAAAKAGLSYDALSYLYDVSEERYLMAQYATRHGLTASRVEEIAKACDADGNGSRKRSEVIAYLDSQNLTREQKMVLFDMLSSSKKNPYK